MENEIRIQSCENGEAVTIVFRVNDGQLIPVSAVDSQGVRYRIGLSLHPENQGGEHKHNPPGKCCCPDGNGGWLCTDLVPGHACSCGPK